jgi:hypothetical protein
MLQLSSKGFACAQIMMMLVLENEDEQNPGLVRTLGALNNGFRDCGLVCGAFTGGACLLSYYAGQGSEDEMPDPDYDVMTQELYDWFVAEIGGRYGGISCPEVLGNDKSNKQKRCPEVVEATLAKVQGILDDHEV